MLYLYVVDFRRPVNRVDRGSEYSIQLLHDFSNIGRGRTNFDHAPMPTAGLLAGSLRAGCIRRGWLPPGCLSPDSWRSISGRRLATGSLQAPCNKAPGALPAAAGAMRAPVENGASAGARVDAGAAVQGRSRCPSPHWTDPCELPLPFLRANEAPARRPATCGTFNWSKLVRPLPSYASQGAGSTHMHSR